MTDTGRPNPRVDYLSHPIFLRPDFNLALEEDWFLGRVTLADDQCSCSACDAEH